MGLVEMLSLFKTPAPVRASGGNGLIDTTIRPICFGIDKTVSKTVAASVGAANFKRYEHILYLMAQLSRIVYCDTGIMWNVIQTSLGLSNDVVNKVITAYDWKYLQQKRQAITSQGGDGAGRPMESYSLKAGTGSGRYGTYISTPDDMTCLFINASKVRANPNSILRGSDVIVSFKGSSTVDNFKHDLMSQFTAADIGQLVASLGIKVPGDKNFVTGSFVQPLVVAWSALVRGLTEHTTMTAAAGPVRLFLTGHSLGGAYCSLFGFMLAEAKVSGLPYMNNVASIHIISFGAPTIMGDNARNTFNRHLDTGLVTVDRVVSQKVPARSAATQILVGGPMGPNNVIPTIPARFSHPGFKPLATDFRPEANGRPYSIENVRAFYGVPSKTRYRDPATWPFNEAITLGDRAQSGALSQMVAGLTQVDAGSIPAAGDVVMPTELAKNVSVSADSDDNPSAPTMVGGFGFTEAKRTYDAATATHIPNFLSVQGSVYAYGFAHAEYLGMFFMGGFRLAGMKNPASTNIAYFILGEDGVKIQYTPLGGAAATAVPATENNPGPVSTGGGRRRCVRSRCSRISRIRRKGKSTRRSRGSRGSRGSRRR